MNSFKNFFHSLRRNTSGKRYLPFVDGIRFIAIMPVIILHASERLQRYSSEMQALSAWESELSYVVSRGAIGVLIFFTLSGFILSLPFAKQQNSFSYKTYLVKRLTRLEPPYIFWMTVFAIVLLFKEQLLLTDILGNYVASIFYVHNITFNEFSIINPVAWSLEVEIQYYLMAPFLAMVYFRQTNVRLRRILIILITLLFIINQHTLGWQYLPYKASILGQFQHFLVGLLMADIYVNAPKWYSKKSLLWDLIGLLSIVTLMFTWTEELGKSIVFMAAMIGLFSGALKGKIFCRVLTLSWVSIIGGMCYTIYLTHLALLELFYSFIGKIGYSSPYLLQLSISLLIAIPMVLLSSMIFYKYLEQPFMLKGAFETISGKLTAGFSRIKGRLFTKTSQL